VTIPEGKSIWEAAPLVRAAGLRGSYARATRQAPPRRLGAPRGTRTLEGLLFPASYQLRRHAPVEALLAKQRAAFDRSFATVSLAQARRLHLSPYDVVIIASMIERETARAADRPLIAAVVYNRLRRRMPLQIDATLRFALRDWDHPLRRSQLASPSPYNTSHRLGLPPTPIGSPGLASLRAAAHPAHKPYLYYVARPGTCGDAFFASYAAFLRASARYEALRAKHGGRAPTTCPR
jgi:UPF0755 protein